MHDGKESAVWQSGEIARDCGTRTFEMIPATAADASFTIPASEAASMAARFRAASAEDRDASAKLIEQHGLHAASEVYVVCAKPLSGALAVDAKSDRAVFTTTIDWVDDDCQ